MDPRILDAKGREIRVGDRVRSTGAETPFVHTLHGEVAEIRGLRAVAVRWERLSHRHWHGVDLMCRCPDLQLLDDREESSNGN